MLKVNNLRIETEQVIDKALVARKCKIQKEDILDFKLIKKSIDARKKNDIHYVCSFALKLKNESAYKNKKGFLKYFEETIEFKNYENKIKSPLIVGSGPAGLFAALYLLYSGIKPILIERGASVDERIDAVKKFWETGEFNKNTNVQFGEGGAGTFSDGKLTTLINDERLNFIKEQFVKFGSPEEILYLSKPHIGTDNLCKTVKNIRNEIISSGGRVLFNTKLEDIIVRDNKIISVVCESNGEKIEIETDSIILAIGHSARDTFEMLKEKGINMERKPFSIGARIEHLQSDISKSQYGDEYYKLPPADYKLSVKTEDNRGVYTFCMCPGGYVVASSSEEGGVVTNGMSCFGRDGENANSAVLVSVNPCDIEGDDVLGGMYLQRAIEKKAYEAAEKPYFAPVQLVGDFLKNDKSKEFGKVKPTYKPGTTFCNIRDILPEFVCDSLLEALPEMAKKLDAFGFLDAVLSVPETRSSSPVRILRDKDTLQSNINGLYPCGEGAGYAGGIMSAALDGIKCAQAFIRNNFPD